MHGISCESGRASLQMKHVLSLESERCNCSSWRKRTCLRVEILSNCRTHVYEYTYQNTSTFKNNEPNNYCKSIHTWKHALVGERSGRIYSSIHRQHYHTTKVIGIPGTTVESLELLVSERAGRKRT